MRSVLLFLVALGCGGDTGDRDGDGVPDHKDCAPANADINKNAAETCDGLDNDCDGEIDEDWDSDRDGYPVEGAEHCADNGVATDCDDANVGIHPGAQELCDGIDNDCTGKPDDQDSDGDGYGSCEDCDDGDAFVFPGAAEACDGEDNDCSGGVDEPWDLDGDGRSPCDGDCDDEDDTVSAHLPEICDGQDNNCDGIVDDGFDLDGDDFMTCEGDCDDADPAVNPAADEICDGVDTDCDGTIQDDLDSDLDGFTLCDGDCRDNHPGVNPGMAELCSNGLDDDCNGFENELPSCFNCVADANYEYCAASVAWSTADLGCLSFGAQLVVLDDALESASVLVTAQGLLASYWIGLHDQTVEGDYEWVDGSAYSFADWGAGEPNDVAGASDCVGVHDQTWQWNDLPCAAPAHFVCEY